MKKALIVFSILLVVAIVSTACFGAAAGTQAIKELNIGNLKLSDFIDNVKAGNYNFDIEDKVIIKEENYNLPLTSSHQLSIDADCVNIKILPTDSEQASVNYKIYSKSESDKPLHNFKLTSENNNTLIEFKAVDAAEILDYAAVMEVYLPKDMSLISVNLDLDASNINIDKDLKTTNCNIDLDASNFDMDGVWEASGNTKIDLEAANLNMVSLKSENADISAEMSNIVIKSDCSFKNTLNVNCEMGHIGIKLSDESNGYTITDNSSLGGLKISDRLNAATESVNMYKIGDGKCIVNVTVEMGGVEF